MVNSDEVWWSDTLLQTLLKVIFYGTQKNLHDIYYLAQITTEDGCRIQIPKRFDHSIKDEDICVTENKKDKKKHY